MLPYSARKVNKKILSGINIFMQTLLDRFNHFKRQAIAVHGDKFDYTNSNFTNQSTPIEIICKEHGSFHQIPAKHIRKGSKGCAKCWQNMRKSLYQNIVDGVIEGTPVISWEEFVDRANKKYKGKYQYKNTNYRGLTKNKIPIVCPIHGEFHISPINHLISKTGCRKCGSNYMGAQKKVSYEKTINECNIKHNYKYHYPEYNKTSYINRRGTIDIICPMHGVFRCSITKHLSGRECHHCAINALIDNNILIGGYSEALFSTKPEIKEYPAILYYISMNNRSLFKIGITRCDIRQRLSGLKSVAKNGIKEINFIKIYKSSLYDCFQKEQQILQKFNQYRIYRPWSTELFSYDILYETDIIFQTYTD